MSDKLTAEQIENWRVVLTSLFGPYALLMPDTEVQEFHDSLQESINSADSEKPEEIDDIPE